MGEKRWISSVEKAREEAAELMKKAQTNPYLSGRLKYIDVYAGLADNARQWKSAFYILLIAFLISVVFCVVLARKTNSVVPYVVEVDSIGQVFPVSPATRTDVDNRIISSQIGQFITNSRTRVLDKGAQLHFVHLSMRSIAKNSAAQKKLYATYAAAPPTNATSPVTVKMTSIISVSKKSYSAEWTEETEFSGGEVEVKHYKGIFEIAVAPPKDVKNLITNPLGVYVMDYQITEEIQ